ncbi:hypothetical protein [Nocardia carnea]|uniref:hypothetical protein n=1 Tax=Nocardia carnea TaxID=37328 RepID=UPI00245419F8|nr:hypothetical protein [Nocardia carnea]
MAAVPPTGNHTVSEADLPWWMSIGPAIATITSLFMLTSVYEAGRLSHMMLDLGLLPRDFLLLAVVPYPVAAAITFALGFLLGGRSPTALVVPALGVMIIGVLLTSFASGAALLLVGRVISGLGAGVAVGVTMAVVRRVEGSRAVAATVVAVLGLGATVAAPFVHRAISEVLDFRVAYLATVLFLLAAILACAVSGIARSVTAGRTARAAPYGMPYPAAPPYPGPQNPGAQYHAPQNPGPRYPAPQYPVAQNQAPQHPAAPYPPPTPGP